MCGIAGILGLENLGDKNRIAEIIMDSLAHRGPDAHGTFIDEQVMLIHTRLSILDLDSRSNQPFYSPDNRYVLVFNGEVYNFREIRAQLTDYPFKTESDTEVILAGWMKWGKGLLQKMNGMFAFALWDKQEQQLTLVRDRLGIKPLYFYQGDQHFCFSSELRTLTKSGLIPNKLNTSVLYEYLKYQTVHAPRTMIEGLYMIPPGSLLQIKGESVTEEVWWKPEENTSYTDKNSHEKIKETLISAVEKRLISDVPFGAFLSGGIDSSLIVGIIREYLNKPLNTFSVTFGEKEYSEAKYSQLIANRFSTQHHEIQLSADDFLNDIPVALQAMDHPSGDGPNSYVVSRAVKQSGITVALSGLGGDELFAGYPFFKQYLELQNKKYLLSYPRYVRNLLAKPYLWLKKGTRAEKKAEILLLPYFDVAHTYPVNRRVLPDARILQILSNTKRNDFLFQDLQSRFEYGSSASQLPALSQISVAEITTYMQNVLLRDTDQMSMAHALEVRVPFLDHNLVELVLGIKDNLKYPKYPKSLLVDSFEGLLPQEIIHREKMGFVLPWEKWLREELYEFSLSGLSNLKDLTYFNEIGIDNLWADFQKGHPSVNWIRVWPLISLGHWIKQNGIE